MYILHKGQNLRGKNPQSAPVILKKQKTILGMFETKQEEGKQED